MLQCISSTASMYFFLCFIVFLLLPHCISSTYCFMVFLSLLHRISSSTAPTGSTSDNWLEWWIRFWLQDLFLPLPKLCLDVDLRGDGLHHPHHRHLRLLLPDGVEDVQGEPGRDGGSEGHLLLVPPDNCFLPLLVANLHLSQREVSSCNCNYIFTRSVGPWMHFGPLDFFLRSLWVLRPCVPWVGDWIVC